MRRFASFEVVAVLLVVTYALGYAVTVSRVREFGGMSPRYSVLPESVARSFFSPAHAIDRRLRPAYWSVRDSR